MRVTGYDPGDGKRPPRAREPFPWFVLALVALAALGLVATSAVRMFRYNVEDAAREQRWRAEHEALMREVAEYAKVP